MSSRTVSILGCGWLGRPLAERLLARGFRVRGSTTSEAKLEALRQAGLHPHRIRVGTEVEGDDVPGFFGVDVLVFTCPPSRDGVAYSTQAAAVRKAAEAHGTGWVIMTSSCAVYPKLDRVVTECDAGAEQGLPLRGHGPEMLAAERALSGSDRFDLTVLRLAGLYGYGRHPARTLAGRQNLPGGDRPVNLVHRDDVIGVIEAVLAAEARGETFNVCADEHPRRGRYYPAQAQALGLEPPTFADGDGASFKVVSNRRLKDRLGYTFQYPDPAQRAP